MEAKIQAKPSILVVPVLSSNVAFSHHGLVALSMADDIGDHTFTEGQAARAEDILV
jgi:hypothetical protein